MSFKLPSFDDLLNNILTDYRNQFPEADTSQGSLIFIKSACMASALWGLYHFQDYISKQIFPDTADTENLEHHAWIRGLARTYGETDAAYLSRLLDYIRRPPAGGNQDDYVKWALTIDNVAAAYCIPLGQGLGTVDVIISANSATGSIVPSSYTDKAGANTAVAANKLIADAANFTADPVRIGDIVTNETSGIQTKVTAVDSATQLSLADDIFGATPQNYMVRSLCVTVKAYIDSVRPVTASAVRVLPPTPIVQNMTMAVTGSNVIRSQIAADITAYIESLVPGKELYVSQLITIAIQNGADNAVVTVPAADVPATTYQLITSGVINVT